jgi:hypothetical protein
MELTLPIGCTDQSQLEFSLQEDGITVMETSGNKVHLNMLDIRVLAGYLLYYVDQRGYYTHEAIKPVPPRYGNWVIQKETLNNPNSNQPDEHSEGHYVGQDVLYYNTSVLDGTWTRRKFEGEEVAVAVKSK